jgi:hypothetical protein
MFSILNILLFALFALVFTAVGAYSHKWLQRVTGAPSNINSAADAADALKNAAAKAAHDTVDAAHATAKAGIEKILS